jgi:hypothetical protein
MLETVREANKIIIITFEVSVRFITQINFKKHIGAMIARIVVAQWYV